MKKILSILSLAAAISLQAQQMEIQKFPAKGGDIAVQPILHAAMVIQFRGQVIYVDPFGGPKAFEGLPAPDLVLMTDIHPDHLNPETLNSLDWSKASIIAPKAVADQLPENLKSKVQVMNNGDHLNLPKNELSLTALPMYNLPETADAMHAKGRGNGYVLELGGKRIYISGDTEDIKEMRELKNIDVAFVCMNLPYTMDVDQAASAVLDFKPKVVIPFHYRGKDGFADVKKFKSLVSEKNKAIDVRLLNWYPEPK